MSPITTMLDQNYARPAARAVAGTSAEAGLLQLARTLWRRKWLTLITMTVVTALGASGQYVKLASAVSVVNARKVTDLGLTGIYEQATTQRQYPGRTTAANILGTVHSDGSGAAGIEAQFNSLLAGHDGSMTYSIDNVGDVNPSSKTVTDPARNGSTIALTIDHAPLAIKAGIDPAAVEAIRTGGMPKFTKSDEQAIYDLASELVKTKRVSAPVFERAKKELSETGVIDLVGIIGYYSLVSVTLNAFELPLPDGEKYPFDIK